MADIAPGRESTDNEPPCYNCGMRGHLFNACPEPARKIPAGLEASRARQQSRNHKGPIITRYPVPMDHGPAMSQYEPRHGPPYPHGPPPPGYPPYNPGSEVPLHTAQATPFDPYRAHRASGAPGLPGPVHPYSAPPFGQQTPFNSSYPYSGFLAPPGPPGPPGLPSHLSAPGPPAPPAPLVHYYAGPPQQYPPPPPYQQQAPPYGSPRPPPGYNEPYYQPPPHAPPPPHHYYPPGEPPQSHAYAGERGQFPYMPDYSRRQDDRPGGQPWNRHSASDSPYNPNGSQSRPYRPRDERTQGQTDRKGRRPPNRYDQRPKNERPYRNYDRPRDDHGHTRPNNLQHRDSRSTTASPHPRMASQRGERGQSLTRDHHNHSEAYGSTTEPDNAADDPSWDERAIFVELPPKTNESPIAIPLPTDWAEELNYPPLTTAVTVESKYITANNVDDFALSIRDTKEWSFKQYHPALLEIGDARPQMLNRYQAALKSWNSQHQSNNKKTHNSKRFKGRHDANRYQTKPYDTNGYLNKPRGNTRYYNKQPQYELTHGNWDEVPQHFGGLPEINGHYGGPDNYGPHDTRYAAERFAAGQVNGDDQQLGHKYHNLEREHHDVPDGRKRRWTELQSDPSNSRAQNSHYEHPSMDHERNNKRSKYVSPEPGEIAEDSDHAYDQRTDSFTPSRREPPEESHQYSFKRDKDDYARHASTKLHEVIENSKDKHTKERYTTLATPVDDASSAAESGEVMESDVQSPPRDRYHKIHDRDENPLPYPASGKSHQVDETLDKRHHKEHLYQHTDGLPNGQYKVERWDGNSVPPSPPGQPPPHIRPSSRRNSKDQWDGSRRDSGQNSRRSSFDDAQPDSPLTPTELALLGLDRPSSSGSDSERESPKRQFDDVTPKLKNRRAKVHEAYSRRW